MSCLYTIHVFVRIAHRQVCRCFSTYENKIIVEIYTESARDVLLAFVAVVVVVVLLASLLVAFWLSISFRLVHLMLLFIQMELYTMELIFLK